MNAEGRTEYLGEQYHYLMDRLDDLFDQVSQHDWAVPQWLRRELLYVQAQYTRINDALEVRRAETKEQA